MAPPLPRAPASSSWMAALAAAPFALTLFVVAMVLGPDLTPPPIDAPEENGSAAPSLPEPASPASPRKKPPSKEEVTYEPWELVST